MVFFYFLDQAGETSVHVAARYGHADAIEQLCKCGANVNVADDVSLTFVKPLKGQFFLLFL